jgi:hypothetical protein
MITTLLALAAISALGGFALGLYGFLWGALALEGAILAIFSAILLQDESYGFFAGVGITVGLLTLNQISYLIGLTICTFASKDTELLRTGTPADDHPGEDSQTNITGEEKRSDDGIPPRAHLSDD